MDENTTIEYLRTLVRGVDEGECVCTIGAQPCPVHPGNTKTQDGKIAFRKQWDARVS